MIENLKEKIQDLKKDFNAEARRVKDEKSLHELRNLFLSRKRGVVTLLFQDLKEAEPEERPKAGQLINDLKDYILLKLQTLNDRLSPSTEVGRQMDLTLPGKNKQRDSKCLYVLNRTMSQMRKQTYPATATFAYSQICYY